MLLNRKNATPLHDEELRSISNGGAEGNRIPNLRNPTVNASDTEPTHISDKSKHFTELQASAEEDSDQIHYGSVHKDDL